MWTVYEMARFLSCPTWRCSSSCAHAATSPAVLYRSSSSTSGRCLSFSSSTECVLPRCEQRLAPKGSSSSWTRLFAGPGCATTGFVVCGSSSSTRSLMRQWFRGLRGAVWRLWKEFRIFSQCSRCSLGFLILFPRAPCIWQPPAPVRCDSKRKLLDDFPTFSM